MPKNKKESSTETDSGPEDRNPPTGAKKARQSMSQKSSNDEETSWSIGKNRFIKFREFKGRHYIDIREYYDADGELKPGKKGISLTVEQWHKLKDCIGDVDQAIKDNC